MLVSLDDLRTKYGFSFPPSQDEVYRSLLTTAEEEVLSYADIEIGPVEEFFEGDSSRCILTHCPALEITSVKTLTGEEVKGYRFEKRADTIILPAGVSAKDVSVRYVCGWVEVPSTIKMAIAFTVQHLSKLQAGKLLGITARNSEGGGTETIEQSTPPLAVQKMLERFRRNKCL